jgi:hypothetical protein
MKKKFLEAYAEKGNMSWAARQVGISNSCIKSHLEADPWFAKHFEEAKEMAADKLEEVMHSRATEGWLEPVFNKLGEYVGDIPKHSDKLLLELARAARPEKFNTHKTTIEHKGKVEHVHVDIAKQALIEKLNQMAITNQKPVIDITPKLTKLAQVIKDGVIDDGVDDI